MKVVYLIYNNTSGLGGHYRSLKSLLDHWGDFDLNFEVYFLGKSISPIFEGFNNVSLIRSNCTGVLEAYKLYKILKKSKPDVIHCYDSTSFFIGRIVSFMLNIPLVFTKCGGKNTMYTPKSVETILFSQENYNYLKGDYNCNFTIIPNRVDKPIYDKDLISQFNDIIGIDYKKVVIRIGNIVSTYFKSLEAAFVLTAELDKQNGGGNLLVIVGKKFDNTIENLHDRFSNVNYLLLDDILFTKEASKMLFISDYVIGTGRGAMEALLLNKPVFVSTPGGTLPIRVNEENFNLFLSYNFSERSTVDKFAFDKTYFSLENGSMLLFQSEENFLAIKGNEKVYNIYKRVSKNKRRVFFFSDFIVNWLRYCKVNRPFRSILK